ncbi:hypothetical protein [Vibrio breoganii]|uniref:hypothetical protein n=1 Tax=Vibrio breoganii TaxID=553239 RepID=UPI000C8398E0|nr:hypothetical protein [Vibrio breoganii]PMG93688.1 hypothetical protein BCU80_07770 [Vibrio breoganii]PMM52262.1 hypothetical protein BCT52_17020 [Vibrio breoganii]
MKDISKEVIVGLVITTILGVAVFFKDAFIGSLITPTVIAQIKEQGHLSEDLKLGQYVVTTEKSFNSNHIVEAEVLLKLKAQEYVLSSQLDEFESETNIRATASENRNHSLMTKQSEKLALMQAQQERIVRSIELLNAKLERKLSVKIYYHSDPQFKGKIRLNSNNFLISQLITNGDKYEVTFGHNSYDYTVVLEPLTIESRITHDAVANLYIGDHNQLFTSARSTGIGTGVIQL